MTKFRSNYYATHQKAERNDVISLGAVGYDYMAARMYEPAAQAFVAQHIGYGTDVRFAYRSPMANRPTPKRLHKGRKRNNGMAKYLRNRGGTFQKRLFR